MTKKGDRPLKFAARKAAFSTDCGLKSPRTQRREAFRKAVIKIRNIYDTC
jgi:hypothetical protein